MKLKTNKLEDLMCETSKIVIQCLEKFKSYETIKAMEEFVLMLLELSQKKNYNLKKAPAQEEAETSGVNKKSEAPAQEQAPAEEQDDKKVFTNCEEKSKPTPKEDSSDTAIAEKV